MDWTDMMAGCACLRFNVRKILYIASPMNLSEQRNLAPPGHPASATSGSTRHGGALTRH